MVDLSSIACTGAFDWLAKRRAEITAGSGRKTTNAEWTTVRSDGSTSGYHNGACHGGMSTPAKSAELIANVSHWGSYRLQEYVDSYARGGWTDLLPQADGERFYDWLVNRSFAAPYVVAPSLDFATNVGLAIRTDIPGNLALAICTLARNCSEQAHIVKRWLALIDAGASEDLAYVLAFGVTPAGRNWGSIIGNHNIVSASNLDYVKAFVSQKPVHLTASIVAGGETYGVVNMWGPVDRNGSIYDDLKRFATKASASEVVIKNPFAPVVHRTSACDDAFILSVIPNLMEYLYDDARQPVRRAA